MSTQHRDVLSSLMQINGIIYAKRLRRERRENVSLTSLSPLAGLNMDVLSVCRPSAIFDEPGLYGIAWMAFITAFLLKWSFKWKLILLSVLKHKSSCIVSAMYKLGNMMYYDSKSIFTHLFSTTYPKVMAPTLI